MNVIRRGTGFLPDGTAIYIEDWTPNYSDAYLDPYIVAAFPVSTYTLPGTWSPDTDRKFRYGIRFHTFAEAAECIDALMRGEKKLVDYADHLERPEYVRCVQEVAL